MKFQRKSAEEVQDDIFRKMSADEKVRLGAELWKLGCALAKNKITYAAHRSSRASYKSH